MRSYVSESPKGSLKEEGNRETSQKKPIRFYKKRAGSAAG